SLAGLLSLVSHLERLVPNLKEPKPNEEPRTWPGGYLVDRELAKFLVTRIKEKLTPNSSVVSQCDVFDRALLNTPSGPGTMQDLWEVTDWRLTVRQLKFDYLRGEVIDVDAGNDNDSDMGASTATRRHTTPPSNKLPGSPGAQSNSRELSPLPAEELEARDSSMSDGPADAPLTSQGSPGVVQHMDISDGCLPHQKATFDPVHIQPSIQPSHRSRYRK
ncbi:hypothetical protein SISNIDRAFT_516615, partial [Sistotremastrum niveocremeum HHB9708]